MYGEILIWKMSSTRSAKASTSLVPVICKRLHTSGRLLTKSWIEAEGTSAPFESESGTLRDDSNMSIKLTPACMLISVCHRDCIADNLLL